jgi:hypothetical protein
MVAATYVPSIDMVAATYDDSPVSSCEEQGGVMYCFDDHYLADFLRVGVHV